MYVGSLVSGYIFTPISASSISGDADFCLMREKSQKEISLYIGSNIN